jgi:hypothetical protein
MRFPIASTAAAILISSVASQATAAQVQSIAVPVTNGTGNASLVYDGSNLSMVARIYTTDCFVPVEVAPQSIKPTTWKPFGSKWQAAFDVRLVHNLKANPTICGNVLKDYVVTGRGQVGDINFPKARVVIKLPTTPRLDPYANVLFLNMTNLNSFDRNGQRLTIKTDKGTKCLFRNQATGTCNYVQVASLGTSTMSYLTMPQTLKDKIGYLDSYESAAFYLGAMRPKYQSILVGHNGSNWVIKATVAATTAATAAEEIWEINPSTFELIKIR